jgi:Fic family protein
LLKLAKVPGMTEDSYQKLEKRLVGPGTMDTNLFSNPAGRLVTRHSATSGRAYTAYIPDHLPPGQEAETIGSSAMLLSEATHALGQLDGIGHFMPNPNLIVEPYMRREAVLSSRIEGFQTTHAELIEVEAVGGLSRADDVRDVHNYVVALEYGLRHVKGEGLTRQLVQDLHRKLMEGARGERFATPGEFRNIQNHIGNTREHADARFVPPPPDEMQECLDALFACIAAPGRAPVLVEAAWLHYQFEAIHPFLDGNGRVGRALIPLFLAVRAQLEHPLLFLSPYFESDRAEYYDRLFAVSTRSDWAGWLRYFLHGVRQQAHEAVVFSRDVIALEADWRERLVSIKATRNAHRLAEHALHFSALDAKGAGRILGVAPQTAYKSIETLVRAGILEEVTGRPWGRVFLSPELRTLLDAGR